MGFFVALLLRMTPTNGVSGWKLTNFLIPEFSNSLIL
jgi:hypothetical protein